MQYHCRGTTSSVPITGNHEQKVTFHVVNMCDFLLDAHVHHFQFVIPLKWHTHQATLHSSQKNNTRRIVALS